MTYPNPMQKDYRMSAGEICKKYLATTLQEVFK